MKGGRVYLGSEDRVGKRGAIVLAGGKSERMGQNKALLAYRGSTLLEHVLSTVRPLVGEILVVADIPTRYQLPEDVSQVADLYPDSGPLGGIVTGLAALGAGVHLVVACDMPHLDPELLRALLNAASPEWDAVVPEIQGRLEPLCAVYSATAFLPLQAFLATGQRAVFKALQSLRLCKIGEEDLRRYDPHLLTFTNINTPLDLAALESLPE